MTQKLRDIGANFVLHGEYISSEPYGSGHINDTFAVTFDQGGTPVRYIFQRINHTIFKDPAALMDNIVRVTDHQRTKCGASEPSRRAMTVIHANDGLPYICDVEGNYWRVYIMIEKARTYDVLESKDQAFQAAKAFGEFQKQLVDIPGGRLNETIPDFHNTPKRFENFVKALDADSENRAKHAEKEIEFFLSKKEMASKLLELSAEGLIPERITHNDTKLNNVMIDDVTGEGLCVIDLDTVMPGLALYDFGDMVRTGTSPAEEDERDPSKVTMRMEMFEALAGGYLSSASDFLTETEIEYLPFSGKLITYEIGLRFITDFLQGDVYFKTHRENHNLDRCRTQMKLVQSIEEQEETMSKWISSHLACF